MPSSGIEARPAFRFAPSPTGRLHLGHVRSALLGRDMAEARGGRYLLRIEDIDQLRCRPEYVATIFEDLAWLGLDWERPVLHQSEHYLAYAAMAQRLLDFDLLYPCFATRGEIAASADQAAVDPDGAPLYPGLWRNADKHEVEQRKAAGEPFSLRLDMAKALAFLGRQRGGAPLTFTEVGLDGSSRIVVARPERWGDAVIVRKEFPASYHLAVVVDDARQGITHVTRGMDLFAATDLHRVLQDLLELPYPLYTHHELITNSDGRKLAKRVGDPSLSELRLAGHSPGDVIRSVRLELTAAFTQASSGAPVGRI